MKRVASGVRKTVRETRRDLKKENTPATFDTALDAIVFLVLDGTRWEMLNATLIPMIGLPFCARTISGASIATKHSQRKLEVLTTKLR